MNKVDAGIVAQIRSLTEQVDAASVVKAIRYFPSLDDAEIAEVVDKVLEMCEKCQAVPEEVLEVVYEYVRKDEFGEENTRSEQEERVRYLYGLNSIEFMDFINTSAMKDF
ncbi:MAG: hypothetical protein PHG16_11320 [Lachnospiraceae bacterium]|nr:hypothetical protein [Lachnospiraceae bacterium]